MLDIGQWMLDMRGQRMLDIQKENLKPFLCINPCSLHALRSCTTFRVCLGNNSGAEPDVATEHIAPASFGQAREASPGSRDMTINSLADVVSKLGSECDESAVACAFLLFF